MQELLEKVTAAVLEAGEVVLGVVNLQRQAT